MSKPYHLMMPSEKLTDRAKKNRLLVERLAQRNTRSLREVTVAFAGKEVCGFSHAETFPAIAAVITALCSTSNNFVGHREIVSTLPADPELGWLLDKIVTKDPAGRDKEWWANSMMSWFSQKFTERLNSFCDTFERDPVVRPYCYRLRKP